MRRLWLEATALTLEVLRVTSRSKNRVNRHKKDAMGKLHGDER